MTIKDLYVCCDNVDSQSYVTVVEIGGRNEPLNLYKHGDLKVTFFNVKGRSMNISVEAGALK